jgi:RNA-directed DNA polymerase
MRIDKDILFGLLAGKTKDETALWLTRLLVYHDCTTDYLLRGDSSLQQAVPPHKTLFGSGANKGLPIGNLNSQFFANVYLNGLDQFVKHELKCRHYLRYCDDFILLANDPNTLRAWHDGIAAFLRDRLALELNPKQRLAPVSNGVDFLGYIVRRDYLLVRRRVVSNLKMKLRAYEPRLVTTCNGVRCYRFDDTVLDELAATLSSYLGHLKLANGWNLWRSLWRRFEYLSHYFGFDTAHWRLVRKYPAPTNLNTVRRQYRYYRWRFPNDVLLFRVGRFYEFYDIGLSPGAAFLGLKRMRWNRRGARYGFPASRFSRVLEMLLSRGMSVLLVGEKESRTGGVCQRVPLVRFVSES